MTIGQDVSLVCRIKRMNNSALLISFLDQYSCHFGINIPAIYIISGITERAFDNGHFLVD